MSSKDDDKFVPLPMFADAVLKANWAKHNIDAMQASAAGYAKDGITVGFEDPDPREGIKKFVVRSQPIHTEIISLQVGDIIRSLRSALDYAVSAIYRSKQLRDNNAYFPFGDTKTNLDSTIEGGLVKAGFPELKPFFSEDINPTQTGNNALWTLNQIDRTNKHRSLTIVVTFVYAPDPNFEEMGVVYRDNWGSYAPGQQFETLVPINARLEDHCDPDPALNIRFGPSEILAGRDVLPTLVNFHKIVVETLQKTQEAFVAAYGS